MTFLGDPARDPRVVRFKYNAMVFGHMLDVPFRAAAALVLLANFGFASLLDEAYWWWNGLARIASVLAVFGLMGLTFDRLRRESA